MEFIRVLSTFGFEGIVVLLAKGETDDFWAKGETYVGNDNEFPIKWERTRNKMKKIIIIKSLQRIEMKKIFSTNH